MAFFSRKKPAALTLAKKDPPSTNGHPTAPIPTSRRKAAPNTTLAKPKDKELAEWTGYLFGNQVPLERISDIPQEAIVHFMVMKLQGRICTLTGGLNDPDLMDELMHDFMELMISCDREGRREMREIISSRVRAEEDDDPEAFLRGKLN